MNLTLHGYRRKLEKLVLTKKRFQVNPETINRELFQQKREDRNQEEVRQIILEAFSEVDNNAEIYGRAFETIIPKKWCPEKNVAQYKELAINFGGHMANWVEQALEWAQRINNGEDWKEVCNKSDTAKWHRLVVWKDNYVHLVGGCTMVKKLVFCGSCVSETVESSFVNICYCCDDTIVKLAVPLIVTYK